MYLHRMDMDPEYIALSVAKFSVIFVPIELCKRLREYRLCLISNGSLLLEMPDYLLWSDVIRQL